MIRFASKSERQRVYNDAILELGRTYRGVPNGYIYRTDGIWVQDIQWVMACVSRDDPEVIILVDVTRGQRDVGIQEVIRVINHESIHIALFRNDLEQCELLYHSDPPRKTEFDEWCAWDWDGTCLLECPSIVECQDLRRNCKCYPQKDCELYIPVRCGSPECEVWQDEKEVRW